VLAELPRAAIATLPCQQGSALAGPAAKVCTLYRAQTNLLRQVSGVGPLTSLAFMLTLNDASRFRKSRDVGAYLGLVPRQDDSGARVSQLAITKAGDRPLRRLLVGSAQYTLGPFGPDCDLQLWQTVDAAGRQERKKARCRGGGAQTGSALASALGHWRGLSSAPEWLANKGRARSVKS
jgi:hypothetical protein